MSAEMSAGHEGRSCQGCWQNFHRTLREETSGMILASLQLKKIHGHQINLHTKPCSSIHEMKITATQSVTLSGLN